MRSTPIKVTALASHRRSFQFFSTSWHMCRSCTNCPDVRVLRPYQDSTERRSISKQHIRARHSRCSLNFMIWSSAPTKNPPDHRRSDGIRWWTRAVEKPLLGMPEHPSTHSATGKALHVPAIHSDIPRNVEVGYTADVANPRTATFRRNPRGPHYRLAESLKRMTA